MLKDAFASNASTRIGTEKLPKNTLSLPAVISSATLKPKITLLCNVVAFTAQEAPTIVFWIPVIPVPIELPNAVPPTTSLIW